MVFQLGSHGVPDRVRPFSFGALLATLLLLLASCSSTPTLESSGSKGPPGRTVPAVVVQRITGVPPGKLQSLTASLAVAGGQHDIGFVEGGAPKGSFTITGQFQVSAENDGVKVVYSWLLRDGDGVLAATVDGDDNAGVYEGTDPWSAVTPAVLERIARRTAETLAQKLRGMGYATRLSRLTQPPAEYFALATPDARREIDFETVNGPGMASAGFDLIAPKNGMDQLPPDDFEPSVAAVDPIPDEGQMVATAAVPEAPEASVAAVAGETSGKTDLLAGAVPQKTDLNPAPPAAKPVVQTAKAARSEIRAVAVVDVQGSPGGGDAELTAAMRKTLHDAGWPVIAAPRSDALTIVGKVQVAAAGSGQKVSVRWEVRSPDGETLGDVKQANDVPNGALDRGWGGAAVAVAESAATGIFDIVKRYQ
jgi:hypothetical protein